MKTSILFALVVMALVAVPLTAQSPTPQQVSSQIQAAYGRADFMALAPHLDERIAFDGEVEVIADRVGGDVVMHDATAERRDPLEPGTGGMAATISSRSLISSYERLVAKVGRERMTAALGNLSWRQLQTDRDGYPYREARAGDWVLYTHFETDEAPDILDEAVIFVLRNQGAGYRVVAHFADF